MNASEFGVDIEACRENLRKQEQQEYAGREQTRRAAYKEVKSAIHRILPAYPSIRLVILFGSIIRPGAFRPDSDIDVAVQGTNAEQYFAFWRDLQEIIPGWFIDLREINKPSYFTTAVLERGKSIYEREVARFEG